MTEIVSRRTQLFCHECETVVQRKIGEANEISCALCSSPFVEEREIVRAPRPINVLQGDVVFNLPSVQVLSEGSAIQNVIDRLFLYSGEPPKKGFTKEECEKILKNCRKATISDIHNTCSICQDNFEEESDIITLSCGHTFNPNCLETWLKTSKSCPVCRTTIAE